VRRNDCGVCLARVVINCETRTVEVFGDCREYVWTAQLLRRLAAPAGTGAGRKARQSSRSSSACAARSRSGRSNLGPRPRAEAGEHRRRGRVPRAARGPATSSSMAEGQVCREAVRRQAQTASRSHAATRAIGRAPSSLPRLAHQLGNRGTHRLLTDIQAKLTVNAPDDEYEREAERVSDEVMRMPDPSSSDTVQRTQFGIQRKCATC
jgi:hypothetical protein